eukprot:325574-Pelagomonas_calceolata.AAC.2
MAALGLGSGPQRSSNHARGCRKVTHVRLHLREGSKLLLKTGSCVGLGWSSPSLTVITQHQLMRRAKATSLSLIRSGWGRNETA